VQGEKMDKFGDEEIVLKLKGIHGWVRDGDYIRKGWIFRDFIDAMTFINRVAFIAEKYGHHPEIFNAYNRVVLKFTTHESGGLTQLDFEMATEINKMN
jgi:4a-hydroxytetrahydrobiopterin dehydratase